MVPQGLIRGAAQKVLNDAWTALEAKLRWEGVSQAEIVLLTTPSAPVRDT